jgi:hypothetical protein
VLPVAVGVFALERVVLGAGVIMRLPAEGGDGVLGTPVRGLPSNSCISASLGSIDKARWAAWFRSLMRPASE